MSVSIDLSNFKSAGIYTVEIDNTQRQADVLVDPLRLIVGFANKGPFNRPVLLQDENQRASIFGEIDTKLEHKGCYFNRMIQTMLKAGPVLALNLLNTDDSYNGKDQVNWAAMSLDSAIENPSINGTNKKYGEYDYNSPDGEIIKYVGQTPYASVYNRSRFWVPDKDLLTAVAARGLETGDDATFEHTNLLNFANVGTEEFSILVFKPSNVNGYDVTVESWYGGKQNIPFGWLRPYDLVSDYFIQIICVKGNWTNYPVLSTDPVWGGYFDKNGIKKNKINNFLYADGVTVLGSWTGVIIPDFVDKQGNLLSIERKVNAVTEQTGLLMSLNKDALNVLNWDLNGIDTTDNDEATVAVCGLDIDGNSELENGEAIANYEVDMVGHNMFRGKQEYKLESEPKTLVDNSTYFEVAVSNPSAGINPVYIDASALFEGTKTDGVYELPAKVTLDQLIDYISPYKKADSEAEYKPELISAEYASIDSSVKATVNLKAQYDQEAIQYAIDCSINGIYITKVKVNPEITLSYKVLVSQDYNQVKFLSYNYKAIADNNDGTQLQLTDAYYFNEIWDGDAPVADDVKNLFVITDSAEWSDSSLKVGDYVPNIAYDNKDGDAAKYEMIPGVAKVIKKQFIQVNRQSRIATYKGKQYRVQTGVKLNEDTNGNCGFYLYTATTSVGITDNAILRQVALSDDRISGVLNFIPMKGLEISSRHRPGYDKDGNLNIEGGISKIYSKLNDEGIRRGLMNPNMANFRYVIDSMSYGIAPELGGKVELSKLAKDKGSCTAILNMPSAKQFAVSSNPYFCDTYITGVTSRPGLRTKYIAEGGNTEMGSTVLFSLPTLDDGSDYTACFFPHLVYQENGREFLVPPAADVANVFYRKFTGVNNPYDLCANMSGILSNTSIKKLEFEPDQVDRDYLEPFGVNCIIKELGKIKIYGNQTAYQDVKSDKNKLHVRENLNTLEIEVTNITKNFNFLYNTPATRAELVKQVIAVLQVMKTSGAIDSYTIQCDEKNNTREVIEADAMILEIGVVMNHGMEKIINVYTLNRRQAD